MHRILRAVLLLSALAPSSVSAQVAMGGEFVVNVHTQLWQSQPAVALHSDGAFVIAWTSVRPGPNPTPGANGYDIRARRYGPSGRGQDPGELTLNPPGGYPQAAALAARPDGGFVAAWQSGDVWLRLFDPDGSAAGPPVSVAAGGAVPRLARDWSVNQVVSWSGAGAHSLLSVHARRYDDAGTALGDAFQVDTGSGCCRGPSDVASDAARRFVVAWSARDQDGSSYAVLARRYDADGSPLGPAFQVNTYTTGSQSSAAVAVDPSGRFVVVWTSGREQTGGATGVFAQRYDETGAPVGSEFRVNSATARDQLDPSVAMDQDGSFVVAWSGFDLPFASYEVFARRYEANGTPSGPDFKVNTYTSNPQFGPEVATDGQGYFVVAWTSEKQDGDGGGVVARRFGPDAIYADGFEFGGLSRWSSTAGGGDLFASSEAAMRGSSLGLQGNVNDTQPLFVQDDSPRGEHRYRARFYFDPGDFDPGEAQGHFRTRLFIGFEEEPQQRRLFAVVLRRRGGEYALMARARADDNAQVSTEFVPITPGPHAVEIAWTRATEEDSGDGSLELWVDGTLAGSVTLDNHRSVLDFVRLGALSLKAGASGTLSWDEFESRRASAVGP